MCQKEGRNHLFPTATTEYLRLSLLGSEHTQLQRDAAEQATRPRMTTSLSYQSRTFVRPQLLQLPRGGGMFDFSLLGMESLSASDFELKLTGVREAIHKGRQE
ncbi:hypothetical protein IE4872_PC00323 (plasmid) [Rhizobium gallicum]|uniref:Uncharacterized protein n=1 Tax=Rhizobium gallicum TaxID=56730 RepID=A0A1L5NR19_9HYPH|nr:hypothetical protein IE4872_PC00323 [Rhizobium gallicum]